MLNNLFFQFLSISNFFLNMYFVYILFFFEKFNFSSQGFILISLVSFFTLGMSANNRNIYLGSIRSFDLNKILNFRIYYGIFTIILSFFLSFLFIKENNYLFVFVIILISVLSWIIELLISNTEKKNELNYIHLISNIILIILLPILVLNNYFIQSLIFLSLISLINIFSYKYIYKLKLNYKLINLKLILNIGILSTLIKTFCNFLWRILIYLNVESIYASILFISFSLGSFVGTIFDISYGAYFLKKIKYKFLLLNSFFVFYLCTVIILILIFNLNVDLDNPENLLLYKSTIASLAGGYFVLMTLKIRQSYFDIKNNNAYLYKIDIISYLFNILLVITIIFYDKNYLYLTYLISSLFFYILYKFINVPLKKN